MSLYFFYILIEGDQMIHLQDDLYIVQSYVRTDFFNSLEFEKTFYTVFSYRDLKITLQTVFKVISHTSYYYLPVTNFGYCVELERWNSKKLEYEYIVNHKEEDSLSTKNYIKEKNVRGIIKKFVFRNVQKYLKKFQPPILIRGALSSYKQSSERYLYIDSLIKNTGYHQLDVPYNCIPEISTKKEENDPKKDIFWLYTRDEIALEEVISNFIIHQDKSILEDKALQLLQDNPDELFISFLQKNLHIGYNKTVELYRTLLQQEKISNKIFLS